MDSQQIIEQEVKRRTFDREWTLNLQRASELMEQVERLLATIRELLKPPTVGDER